MGNLNLKQDELFCNQARRNRKTPNYVIVTGIINITQTPNKSDKRNDRFVE